MAKKSTEAKASNWYRVLEPSFINDALKSPGEFVQYDGVAGSNLESVSEDDVRASGQVIPEVTIDQLDNREGQLNQREKEIAGREEAVQVREKEIEDLTEAADKRAKELDDREAALKAKEDAAK